MRHSAIYLIKKAARARPLLKLNGTGVFGSIYTMRHRVWGRLRLLSFIFIGPSYMHGEHPHARTLAQWLAPALKAGQYSRLSFPSPQIHWHFTGYGHTHRAVHLTKTSRSTKWHRGAWQQAPGGTAPAQNTGHKHRLEATQPASNLELCGRSVIHVLEYPGSLQLKLIRLALALATAIEFGYMYTSAQTPTISYGISKGPALRPGIHQALVLALVLAIAIAFDYTSAQTSAISYGISKGPGTTMCMHIFANFDIDRGDYLGPVRIHGFLYDARSCVQVILSVFDGLPPSCFVYDCMREDPPAHKNKRSGTVYSHSCAHIKHV